LGWTIEYDPEAIRVLNNPNHSIRLEIFRYMQERIAQTDSPRNPGGNFVPYLAPDGR
jgi:hypothetical protein